MTRYELDKIKQKLYDMAHRIELPEREANIIPLLDYVDIADIDKLDDIDFDDNIAGTTKIREDFTMDDLISILSDGLSMQCGFEDVDYDKNEYYQARAELMSNGWTEDMLTLEAVQAKMLMMNFTLTFFEPDSHKKHKVSLKTILRGFDKFIAERMKEWKCSKTHAIMQTFESCDFWDFDAMLQLGVYGEVIYG